MVPTADQAAGILQSHTRGVNEACAAMVRGAREAGDECGPLHRDLEQTIQYVEGRRCNLRADAILRYIRSAGSFLVLRAVMRWSHRGNAYVVQLGLEGEAKGVEFLDAAGKPVLTKKIA